MDDMSLVPKLRFKKNDGSDFPNWIKKKFNDIYSFFHTNSYPRSLLDTHYGYVKNIHYGDIHTKLKSHCDVATEKIPYLNKEVDISKIKDTDYCMEGDLIIADASEDYKDIGKTIEITNLNQEKIVAGLHTYIARDLKKGMALGFGAYMMQTYKIRQQMMILSTGISVLSISKSNLSKLEIHIPSIEEQEKIAGFLTAVDELIADLTKKESLLQKYKKGVMQKIFSQELRFKQDDGSDYPDWKEKKLEALTVICTGKSNREDSVATGGAFTFFDRSQDIRTSSKYLFDCEAVIVPGEGQDFIPKYFHGKFDLHQRTYAILKSDEKKANNLNFRFLYYFIFVSKNYFLSQAVGSTVKSLRLPLFKNLNVSVPCLEEQQKIANFLSSIDDQISIVQKQLDKTKQYKKALLQQLFI